MGRGEAGIRRAAMERLAEEHKSLIGRSLYIGNDWDTYNNCERALENELSRFAEFTFCTIFNASLSLSEEVLTAHRRILKRNGKIVAIAFCDKNTVIDERRIGLYLISKAVLCEDNGIQIVNDPAASCGAPAASLSGRSINGTRYLYWQGINVCAVGVVKT